MQSSKRKAINFTILGTLVLLLVFFIAFQSKNLITGPIIIISEPLNGGNRESSLALVSGKALNVSEIKLNGKNIFVDEEGNFEEHVLLSYGYNRVVVEAKDRFNRKKIKELELTYK